MKAALRLLVPALACLLSLSAAPTARAQQHTFGYRVTINGIASDWHTLGLRPGGLPGLDAFDLPQPPPPPGFPFQTYFVMLEPPSGLPNRWLNDFRPVGENSSGGSELWQFVIESPDAGAACRLELQDLAPVSSAYDLYLIGADGAPATLALPATIEFPLDGVAMTRYLELHYGSPIPVAHDSWGGVKALYRR